MEHALTIFSFLPLFIFINSLLMKKLGRTLAGSPQRTLRAIQEGTEHYDKCQELVVKWNKTKHHPPDYAKWRGHPDRLLATKVLACLEYRRAFWEEVNGAIDDGHPEATDQLSGPEWDKRRAAYITTPSARLNHSGDFD